MAQKHARQLLSWTCCASLAIRAEVQREAFWIPEEVIAFLAGLLQMS